MNKINIAFIILYIIFFAGKFLTFDLITQYPCKQPFNPATLSKWHADVALTFTLMVIGYCWVIVSFFLYIHPPTQKYLILVILLHIWEQLFYIRDIVFIPRRLYTRRVTPAIYIARWWNIAKDIELNLNWCCMKLYRDIREKKKTSSIGRGRNT